jgi:hypothetical protein
MVEIRDLISRDPPAAIKRVREKLTEKEELVRWLGQLHQDQSARTHALQLRHDEQAKVLAMYYGLCLGLITLFLLLLGPWMK